MANETRITDIVDKSSLDALDAMNFKINEIVKTYQKAVKEIGTGLSIKVNGLEDYSKKLQALTVAIEKSVSADNALKEAKKEQEALLKRVAEQMKENVKEALEKAKADKIAEQASLAAAKAETERRKQEKLINQTRRQAKVSVEEAIALTKKEAKTLQETTDQNRLLRAAKMNVDITTEAGRKIVMQMNAAIDKNTETIRRNADAMVKQKMTIGDYKEQVKGAIISIQNGDRSMKNFGVVAKGYGGILKTHVASGFDEVRMGVGSMIKGMVGAQAVIGGFQRLLSLFSSGVGSIISFEAANSKLAAVLGTTSKNIKDLISDAQRLGATTKYTAAEATNLQIELAKLGFSKNEILQSTEGILKFAQATGAELPEAAALAGASLRMFDASARETERYVSAMAVATAKSALSFSYLQTAMPIVGPVAKAFNFQIEDTLALLGKLSDSGFDASMAATATRNILLNLADGNGKLATALGSPVKTLPDLVAGLKKLKDQGVDLNSTLELTDKRSVAAFNAFLTSADKIVKMLSYIGLVFKNDKNRTSFSNCFYFCSSLTTIPAGLFDNCTAVPDFGNCFYFSSLTTIPAGLFDNCTAVTNFGGCFNTCMSLTTIPAGLFDNCTAVTSFGGCFDTCKSLTTIPAGLFDSCTAVTGFNSCFDDCRSLTTIPAGLFDNCTAVTYFNHCFNGCSSLTTIPAGLFDSCTAVTGFNSCFNGCPSLTTIPAGLFDNCTVVKDFNYCFNGCREVTSLLPTLWVQYYGKTIDKQSCFYGCTKAANWSKVPKSWGGTAPEYVPPVAVSSYMMADYRALEARIRNIELQKNMDKN